MAKENFPPIVRYILIALVLAALAVIVWRLSEVMIIAFGGVVVATLIRAVANLLRRFRRLSDHGRIGIAVAILVIAVGGFGWFFGHQVASQFDQLRTLLPQQASRLADSLSQSNIGKSLLKSIHDAAHDHSNMAGFGIAAFTFLGGLLDGILILFIGFYFALDPKLYVEGGLRLLPPGQRSRVREALFDAGDSLQRWLAAQLIAMMIVGILAGTAMALLKVPLALVLGTMAALLEFIPVVGPILFGIPAVLVAFAQGPHTALYALIAYIAIQQLESNVIIPLLQRWAVEMPPVVGLLAVVASGILLGPPGVIFAAPLAVVGMSLVGQLYVSETLEHPGAKHAPRSKRGDFPA